jgi:medium-chain acyl-[acyl-carrier-protein] hydrolase
MPGLMTRSRWLPFGAAPDAAVRLLCLPHAGAGATAYRAWGAEFPAAVGVCPVQPPGREKRRREPPLTTAQEIAVQLADEISEAVRPPYAIFGHSTGAVCAFEVVREIRRRGGPEPVHLFVSGRQAPQQPLEHTPLDGLSVDELAVVLRRLGGTPDEVLGQLDVLAMLQPLLVADFTVNESYLYRPEQPLDVPVTAFAATRDRGAEPERMAAWAAQTTASFAVHALSGGHFAIFDHARSVAGRIAADLARWQ